MNAKINTRGFTLLLAALVASIVLAIGAAIYGIAIKELNLSSIGRDSQFAFYAADTAAECALYNDINKQIFSTTSPPAQISCDGVLSNVAVVQNREGSSWSSTVFSFQSEPNGICATTRLTKTSVGNSVSKLIRADGSNVPCAATTTSPRALQRSVELGY